MTEPGCPPPEDQTIEQLLEGDPWRPDVAPSCHGDRFGIEVYGSALGELGQEGTFPELIKKLVTLLQAHVTNQEERELTIIIRRLPL